MPPWEAKKFDVFCLLPVACAKRKRRYFGYSGAVCLSHFLTRFRTIKFVNDTSPCRRWSTDMILVGLPLELWSAPSQNDEVENTVKLGVFATNWMTE